MKIHAVLQPYCNLMQDIKIRTSALQTLSNNPPGIPENVVAECEQLQIRMISETLAIACLLVHGDVEGARSARLAKAYQADLIINSLEKLHSRFYPRATRQILTNGVPSGLEDVKDGFLTKDEMLKAYREAAGYLHVGNLADFLANERTQTDRQSVRSWVRKLMSLLSCHTIFLADRPDKWEDWKPNVFSTGEPAPRYQIIALMNPDSGGGYPRATLFETIRQAEDNPRE